MADTTITVGGATPAPAPVQNTQAVNPPPPLSDLAPVDPDRTPFVSPGATHGITGTAVGTWARGDKVGVADFPTGQAGVDRLVSLGKARPLTADESKGVPSATAPAKAPAK